MYDRPERPSPVEERSLDLLVDGELADAARRTLLERLDREPGGWRRCALAFLEAQAWRREMRSMAGQRPSNCRRDARLAAPFDRRRIARRAFATCCGITALALAFVLGWLAHRPPAPTIADSSAAGQRADDQSQAGRDRAGGSLVRNDDQKGAAVPAAVKVAGLVAWPIASEEGPRDVAVPVLEGPGIDMRWLLHQPPPIGKAERQALERRGHKVEQSRQFVSVSLQDGRRVIVPIDRVNIRPAARVFQ